MNAEAQEITDIFMKQYDALNVKFFRKILSNPECAIFHDITRRMLDNCERALSKGVKQ